MTEDVVIAQISRLMSEDVAIAKIATAITTVFYSMVFALGYYLVVRDNRARPQRPAGGSSWVTLCQGLQFSRSPGGLPAERQE